MLRSWPTIEEIKKYSYKTNEQLQVEASKHRGVGVCHIEVPTVMGRFGIGTSAFGVVQVFYPEHDDFEIIENMNKYNLAFSSWGHQQGIEAGIDLMGYLLDEVKNMTSPVDLSAFSPFQQDVFSALCSIPFGETITFGELATLARHPGRGGAVAKVLEHNPAPIFIPCHRVLTSNGGLGKKADPTGWKEWLLEHEGHRAQR